MTNRCHGILDQFNDYLDGNLENPAALLSHIENCKQCRQEITEYENTMNIVKSLNNIQPPEASPDFAERIINRLKEDIRPTSKKTFSHWYLVAAIFTMTILAGFIIIGTANNNPAIVSNNQSQITEAYANDFNQVLDDADTSILAESGLPTDEWGLIDWENL